MAVQRRPSLLTRFRWVCLPGTQSLFYFRSEPAERGSFNSWFNWIARRYHPDFEGAEEASGQPKAELWHSKDSVKSLRGEQIWRHVPKWQKAGFFGCFPEDQHGNPVVLLILLVKCWRLSVILTLLLQQLLLTLGVTNTSLLGPLLKTLHQFFRFNSHSLKQLPWLSPLTVRKLDQGD